MHSRREPEIVWMEQELCHLRAALLDARRRANQHLATVWVVAGMNFMGWAVYLLLNN